MYDIVIIGFGVSGIASAMLCKEYNKKFIVIEKKHTFGGCWEDAYNFTSLQSDKKFYQYPNNPMPKEYPTYPNQLQIKAYLNSVINKYNLENYVVYNSLVVKTLFDQKKKKWNIYYKNGENNNTIETHYLLICNGYYNKEIIPNINLNNFKGTIYTAKTLKNNFECLKNKNVTIIGNGATCCDILNGISLLEKEKNIKSLCKKLTIVYRSDKFYIKKFVGFISVSLVIKKYILLFLKRVPLIIYRILFKIVNLIFFSNYLNVPKVRINHSNIIGSTIIPTFINKKKIIYIKDDIIDIVNNHIILKKNYILNNDIIILATGYTTNFSFLQKENTKRFKQIIDPEIENCGFIGLSPSYNWAQVSYNQAKWFLENLSSNNKLSKKLMYDDIDTFDRYQTKFDIEYDDLTYEIFNYLKK